MDRQLKTPSPHITPPSEPMDLFNMKALQLRYSFSSLSKKCEIYQGVNLTNKQSVLAHELLQEYLIFTKQLLQIPSLVIGYIYTSGSQSNLYALYHMRQRTHKNMILCSQQTHSSIELACDMLGMTIKTIDTTIGGQRDTKQVSTYLQKYSEQIAGLVITAGTTSLGTIEYIDEHILEQISQDNMYVHIDAAYGGLNIGCLPDTHPEKQKFHQLVNHPAVNSLSIDFHKFIGSDDVSMLFYCNSPEMIGNGKSIDYFKSHTGYGLTTVGAHRSAITLEMMKHMGKRGLQHLAYKNFMGAKKFQHILQKHHIPTFKLSSTVIAIPTKSRKHALSLKKKLLRKYKLSTSFLHFGTYQQKYYGIRIVVTGARKYTKEDFEYIATCIEKEWML